MAVMVSLLMITLVVVLMALGMPIGFAFCSISIMWAMLLFKGLDGLYFMALNAYSNATIFTFVAIPLFILMAEILIASGAIQHLFQAATKVLKGLRGELLLSSMVCCTVFAAVTGSSAANTATIGLAAIPEMLKRGYDKGLACGCIVAGGALGILIPPSIFMVIYGMFAEVSIGRLFMGGLIPGLLLAALFAVYMFVRCNLNPRLAPAATGTISWKDRISCLPRVLPVLGLAVFMMVALYMGVATPTEVAGLGALLAFVILLFYRRFNRRNVERATRDALRVTCMIFFILIGAKTFGYLTTYVGIAGAVADWIHSLHLAPIMIMLAINILLLILGCFLDPGSICMIFAPILIPIVEGAGYDLIFFGVVFTVNMELAQLTPPVGGNLFILKGITPPEVTFGDILGGATPFVVLQAVGLALVIAFPQLALWLPSLMK